MSKDYNYSPSLNEIIQDSFSYMRKKSYVIEGLKGCLGEVSKVPVSLESSFKDYRCMDFGKQSQMENDCDLYILDDSAFDWRYLRVWFAKQDDDFKSQEAFKSLLNRLGALGQKFKVTLGGNKERVSLTVGVDKVNVAPAKNAIVSIYPRSEIDVSKENHLFESLKKNNSLKFMEYFTQPPYWRSLSCPDQRFTASLLPCLCSEVGVGEAGFYELIVQPCRNDWGSNIYNLCNAESEGGVPLHVSKDWREAGFGNDYSDKTKQKINTPMYAAMIRVGAYCGDEKIDAVLKTLSLPVVGLLWGGQRLKHVTEQDFIKEIGEEKTREMILNSETYRTGSLFSLDELSYLSPFFEKEDLIDPKFNLDVASGIYVPEQLFDNDGAYIGQVYVAGKSQSYFQAEKFRKQGTSIRSVNGGGKSNLQAQIFGHDLEKKRKNLKANPDLKMSIVLIDFCKDAYTLCLHKLKSEDASFIKIFDPTIKGYFPKYNIVSLRKGEDIDRKADNRTSHLRNLYSGNEWGGGIELIIKNAFYLLLADPDAVLTDIRLILEDSPDGKERRARALVHLDNEEVRKFWVKDFYDIDDRRKNVALRKVTAFLTDKRIQGMFSVKENCFDASEILSNGDVLLCNVSEGEIGDSAARLLAGSISGDVANAGKARAEDHSPKQRELMPCHFTIDEFFKIFHKEFESFTVSMRKFNVCLNLSYHFDEQLSKELQAGIKNFGTHIAMKQSFDQARNHAYPQFLGKVEPNDFINLNPGGGYIVTPNSQVIKFKSDLQKEDGDQQAIKMIIEKNLNENYVKISDLKKEVEEKEAQKKTKNRMGEEI